MRVGCQRNIKDTLHKFTVDSWWLVLFVINSRSTELEAVDVKGILKEHYTNLQSIADR